MLGGRASYFLVSNSWVVTPCQTLEEPAASGNDRIGRDGITIATRDRTMRTKVGMDTWIAIVRRNIALVVHTPFQVVKAWHGNVKMRLTTCRVALARALIVDTDDQLATRRRCQECTFSTTKEIVTCGCGPIHGCTHVIDASHCGTVGCTCVSWPELLATS